MRLRVTLCILTGAIAFGCTAESTRIAIDTQQRVDEIQQGVVDRQHDGLRVLLFRDMLRRMRDSGAELSDDQVATLNTVWNERDLVEFWALQNERALGLRRVGVDSKLYSEQAVVDLLWKSLETKTKRLEQAIAAEAGAKAAAGAAESATPPPAESEKEGEQ